MITARTSSGKKITCKVTVPKNAIKSTKLKLNKKSIALEVGKTFKIIESMTPKNTTDNVTFSSNNKNVASVDNTGKIKALKPGKATITVKTTSGKTKKMTVTVKK